MTSRSLFLCLRGTRIFIFAHRVDGFYGRVMVDGIEVKVDGNGGFVGALLLALPRRPQLPSVDPELHRICFSF